MLLLMDTLRNHHRHDEHEEALEEKKTRSEMLVKHEFSAKADARIRRKFIACARYVALIRRMKLLPFELVVVLSTSSTAIKEVQN